MQSAHRRVLIFDDFNSCVEKRVEKNPFHRVTEHGCSALRSLHTDGAVNAGGGRGFEPVKIIKLARKEHRSHAKKKTVQEFYVRSRNINALNTNEEVARARCGLSVDRCRRRSIGQTFSSP